MREACQEKSYSLAGQFSAGDLRVHRNVPILCAGDEVGIEWMECVS
jgi:hypothetical protein